MQDQSTSALLQQLHLAIVELNSLDRSPIRDQALKQQHTIPQILQQRGEAAVPEIIAALRQHHQAGQMIDKIPRDWRDIDPEATAHWKMCETLVQLLGQMRSHQAIAPLQSLLTQVPNNLQVVILRSLTSFMTPESLRFVAAWREQHAGATPEPKRSTEDLLEQLFWAIGELTLIWEGPEHKRAHVLSGRIRLQLIQRGDEAIPQLLTGLAHHHQAWRGSYKPDGDSLSNFDATCHRKMCGDIIYIVGCIGDPQAIAPLQALLTQAPESLHEIINRALTTISTRHDAT
jgi:hypothetical protein